MEDAIYFIHIEGEQKGPLRLEQLSEYGLTRDTMIWRRGMPSWVKAHTLPEVAAIIESPAQVEPPVPEPTPYQPVPPATNQQVNPVPNPYEQPQPNYNPNTQYQQGQPEPQPQPQYAQGMRTGYNEPQNPYRIQNNYDIQVPGWYNWSSWATVGLVLGFFTGIIGMVFGILGLVKSNQANEAARNGNPAADEINKSARLWTLISIGISSFVILSIISYIVIIFYSQFFDDIEFFW